MSEPSDPVKILLNEIEQLTQASDFSRKVDLCYQALNYISYQEHPLLWAELHNEIAISFALMPQGNTAENLEKAIEHFELTLKVYTRGELPADWAIAHSNLGSAFWDRIRGERSENIELSILHYKQALEVYTLEEFPNEWANTQNNIAAAYKERVRGEHSINLELARYYCEQALHVYTREEYPLDWAMTQNNLGVIYKARIQGDHADNIERAILHYQQSLEVYSREEFPLDWATTQNNLGSVVSERIHGERAENCEQAITYYDRALEVYTPADHPLDWAMTQNNLGNAYMDRIRGNRSQNIEYAILCSEQALQVYTKEEFPIDWGMAQHNLGVAYKERLQGDRAGNIEQSIQHYEEALRVRTQDSFPERWAMTQNNLGNAYRDRIFGDRSDNTEKSIAHYQEASKVYTKTSFPLDWAMVQNNLAAAFSDRISGEPDQNISLAIDFAKKALELYSAQQIPHEVFRTASNIGNLYTLQANWREAHSMFKVARQSAEFLFRSSMTTAGQRAEVQQLSDLYDRDIASCTYLYNSDPSVVFDALMASEAARSRSFLRQLGFGDFSPPPFIPTSQVMRERDLIAQLRDIEIKLQDVETHNDRMTETERELIQHRRRLNNDLQTVYDEMLATHPEAADYIALRQGDSPNWEDLRKLAVQLGYGTALIEFHMLNDRTLAFVWCADWDAPKLLSLPITSERLLYRYLRSYEREVLNRSNTSQASLSKLERFHDWLELGNELLSPIEPLLKEISLVYFIPHQYLHLLPLHALTVDGIPFIARHAVAYAPSAAVLARVMRHHLAPQNEALIMGYTEHPNQRDSFVGEAIEIAKLLETSAIVNENATSTVLTERAGGSSLIHLSCHGVFDGNEPLNSAVILADGPFTVRQWMRLNLRSDLVTLSACQLALNELNPGDDLIGMTRALMYAGVSTVLLALWSVRADTTLEWMLNFYGRLGSDDSPEKKAQAFRHATLTLREKYNEPYVWAPFVLMGAWQ